MKNPIDFITGLHHLTVNVGSAQEDVDFMTKVLGMRMVKQTVLFDGDIPVYHLYYTNANAEIGSVWTSFPYRKVGKKGRKGSGQMEYGGLSVPDASLEFWVKHLNKYKVDHSGIITRFGQRLIEFEEPSGVGIALMGDNTDKREAWETSEISKEDGVKGLYGLIIAAKELTEMDIYLKEVLGFTQTGKEGAYTRYHIHEGGATKTIDIHHVPDMPQGSWTFGEGSPHHVAFATPNDEANLDIKFSLDGHGFTDTSELKDRNYFHSIYSRTPSGVLFEFATSDIGFAVDEDPDLLGHQLLLPPRMQDRREEIIAPLEKLKLPDYLIEKMKEKEGNFKND